jgi:CTP:molybdopterin cytidylyltransferase MocA
LSHEFDVPAGVLVTVAGRAAVARAIDALRASGWVTGGILCGPEWSVVERSEVLQDLLSAGDYRWLAPQPGPAASAVSALSQLARPVLLTTGDHALLSAKTVADFCRTAQTRDDDAVVGVVPYRLVQAAYPKAQRTVYRFTDGDYCGSNLFAVLSDRGDRAPLFWRRLETERKRPWRIARGLGWGVLLRYLARRLSLPEALREVSERAGCRIGHVVVNDCDAAVDIDTIADWHIAEERLKNNGDDQRP